MQVIKPLLPKSKGKEEPRALRSFSEAERLMGEDARFLRAPARDRCKCTPHHGPCIEHTCTATLICRLD